MAIDSRPAHHLGSMGYDPMRQYQPQFTNPWGGSSNASPPHQMYNSIPQSASSTMDNSQASRAPIMSMGYVANPAASSLGSDLVPSRSYGSQYNSSAPTSQPVSAYAPTSAPRYSPEHQAVSPYDYEPELARRPSFGYVQHNTLCTASANSSQSLWFTSYFPRRDGFRSRYGRYGHEFT